MEVPINENVLNSSDDAQEPIFQASFGDYYKDDILQLLKSKNPEDAGKLKLLIIEIVSTNNLEAFEFLMLNGYKIDVINSKNQTCIHLAYYTNSWNILSACKLWLPNLSDDMITCIDTKGLTFLHIACYIADPLFVKKCLTKNLDVNTKCYPDLQELCHNGFTALHFASMSYKLSIVKLLLVSGGDVSAIDSEGRTPLHIACCVFQDPDSELPEENLQQQLYIIELLVENNSNLINVQDKRGNTPLFSIFSNNYNNLNPFDSLLPIEETKLKLDLLLEKNIDLTVKNNKNDTILHCIIKNLKYQRLPSDLAHLSFDDTHHLEMINKIFNINFEIDLNEKNMKGQTPLQLAVFYMSIDIVKVLLENGAYVNTVKFDVINNGHCFYYPFIVPNLESVINIELIISLLSQKNFQITLEENLNILKFLVHNVENCKCFMLKSLDDIVNRLGKIINFGPLQHGLRVFKYLKENKNHGELLIVFIGKHIQTKKISQFYVSSFHSQYLALIEKHFPRINSKNQYFDEMLESAITRMKSTTLKDDITLYDVLTKHPHNVHNCLKDIETYSLVLDLLSEYDEIIKDIIEGHVTHSLIRNYIERSAFDYWKRLFPILPERCCKIILQYLDEENIVNVCSAAII